MRHVVAISALLIIQGCATGPDYRVDYDRTVAFDQFRTYAFFDETGTERRGYSTLISQYFEEAIKREMNVLGYAYSEEDPDLLVNYTTTSQEKTEIRSRPSSSMTMGVGYGGYYGYRAGMYGTWPMYNNEVETVNYKVGTATIDVVDADRKVLIWEGTVEGRLTSKALENPKRSIDAVVQELFARYPTAAGNQ